MKICPNCKKSYDDDANFCPEESCATAQGPRRLDVVAGGMARFNKQQRLGGSHTGEVWQAVDTQTGAPVVLKIVASDVLPNAAALARAEREFKQLQRVSSPHLVNVIDSGKTDEGRLWVAMDLVDGEPLSAALRRGAVDLDRAKGIVSQIGNGLLEAQKVGLVHRDLAPKNVLLDAAGQVKLINFAVAVPLDGTISGVPEYASPEQGQGRPVDQRSNTYSLACIFYHLVTGEPPFSGPDARQVFALHSSSPALAPSQRRPDAALSPDVDRTVLKALDKNSSRRHLTLRLFLNEIEALTVAAAPTAGAGKADVGFAKTMLFAGGQAEVQQMVAKAIATRQAAKTASPVPAAPATPAPVHVPQPVGYAAPSASPSAAMAPTMVPTMAADASLAGASRLTPPPVTPNPTVGLPAAAAAAVAQATAEAAVAKKPAAAGSAAFRETLWFKKGDVEQMVAEAKAKAAAAGKPVEEAVEAVAKAPDEDIRPVEDRYVDDGSVTTDDRKKFSLRTGGTATAIPTVGKRITGEGMSEADMVSEMKGSGNKMGLVIGAVAVVVVGVVLALMLLGGEKKDEAPKPGPAAALAPPGEPAVAARSPTPVPSAKKAEGVAATNAEVARTGAAAPSEAAGGAMAAAKKTPDRKVARKKQRDTKTKRRKK